MFDAPIDTLYVWVGLAVVATAVVATATAFPTAPPPDAGAAASTVDRVAAAGYPATDRHSVDAAAVKLEPTHVALRDSGRTTRARFARSVTPVRRASPLWRVLLGVSPAAVFAEPAEFRDAVETARDGQARWRSTDRLVVRTVTWGDLRVTLVGA